VCCGQRFLQQFARERKAQSVVQELGKGAETVNSLLDEPSARFYVLLMACAATVLAGTLGLVILSRRRRKTPEEAERFRRLDVNRRGRVTHGQIVDVLEPEPGKKGARLVVFKYEVAGVTYEAAQDISTLPNVIPKFRRATGQMIRLKYAIERPTNSIIACEEWSGVPEGPEIRD
jgi:hypothetical protein